MFSDPLGYAARGHSSGSLMTGTEADAPPMVFVVDDDPAMRDALSELFASVNLNVEAFGSTREFLEYKRSDAPACLILDVRLPGLSGLDFQAELSKAGIHIPIIFLTGHGDIPMTVRAMKAGAVEFLTKPFREQDIFDAVGMALERERDRRKETDRLTELRNRFDLLTSREQEVMGLVISGLQNKQIAYDLNITLITVKVHRGNVMRKMFAKSLADLVRMADDLGIRREKR